MTTQTTQAASVTADRELVAAARVLLQRMGVDPADLMQNPTDRPRVPTFDEYIPEVEAANRQVIGTVVGHDDAIHSHRSSHPT